MTFAHVKCHAGPHYYRCPEPLHSRQDCKCWGRTRENEATKKGPKYVYHCSRFCQFKCKTCKEWDSYDGVDRSPFSPPCSSDEDLEKYHKA